MDFSLLRGIWILVQLIIGYNLLLPIFLFCWYKFFHKKITGGGVFNHEPDYAIIVTAYEQSDILKEAIASILQLNYKNFIVYVVADKCDISNLSFNDEKVFLFRPEEPLNSNTKSHFYAIDRFKRDHTYLTIIDSDNLVEPEYLNKLNEYFAKGFIAVQGMRKAKNLDTTYACLDAARDMYYHFYDGEILFNIGSSTTLSGSGMAFTTELYRECLENLEVSGAGFDKKLQIEIIKRQKRIAFTRDAIVFDEKTSMSDQLVRQRARWINAWFKYFILGFRLLWKGIINQNLNQFLFAVMLIRPPLFIFLILSLVSFIFNLLTSGVMTYFWIVGFILFILSFIIALLSFKADKKIYSSLLNIPTFMFYQILSLFKVRKANQYSVATKHFHNKKIDEVI
ncbi:MAG: glycosyltransferase family 2 protein [Flavisolibacter sp.]